MRKRLGSKDAVRDPRLRGLTAWPLIPTIAILVGVAATTIVLVYLAIGQFTPIDDETGLTSAQRITAAFAAATAAGAVVALVVNVRRQHLAEQGASRELTSAFIERFAAAASQLGSTAPAERLAGVYAMTALADEYPTRRQQCVDVLCGYLRLPFDPDTDHLEATSIETTVHDETTGESTKTSVTHAARPFDRQVRETIVRLIVEHLQLDASPSWSALSFDFTGAHLTNASFEGATFKGWTVSFRGVTFVGETSFAIATFSEEVWFDGATFSGGATSFEDVKFYGETTSFKEATFTGRIWFSEAKFFGSALFREAKFTEEVWFDGATFLGVAGFEGSTFSGGTTSFDEVKFVIPALFRRATFSGETTSFVRTNFRNVWFDGSTFSGETSFNGSTFSGETSFDGSTFAGETSFDGSTFSGETSFEGSMFSGDVTFSRAVRDNGALLIGLRTPFTTGDATITADGAPFIGWPDSSTK